MRVNVEGQWFLLHHFEGGGRNQIRFKIPVLATTRHPDISSAQPVTQFRERAQFIEVPIHSVGCKHMGSPARFHETGRHVLGQRTLPAGIEIAEQIESLQQLVRSRRGMEFKMREQERRELTHATVALVERREIVKFFRLSERLRFSHGRFKLGPWQYGLDSGKYIGAAGTRLDERLAYPGVEPYFLVDRFAASVELLGVGAFRSLEHLPD